MNICRSTARAVLAFGFTISLALGAGAAHAEKVLRYGIRIAETSFDPAQISDLYSRTIAAGIFDAPYEWEFFAKPARFRPNTAAGMPEISADFKTITVRIKPGIYFAEDPAFKGKQRELVAEDYVYAIKRHYDPRWKSQNLYAFESAKMPGLSELRKRAIDDKKPFDYDAVVEGVRALDRYTFQVRLGEPDPRFIYNLTDGSFTGAVAREVVEMYGDKVGEHPVGTGPFVLQDWRRSSRITLARNPKYREVLYDETAPEGNERLKQFAAKNKGRRLPLLDKVEIHVIQENQPRWLSFVNGEHDVMEEVPNDFATTVLPNNKLAPNLAKKGMELIRYLRSDISMTYFAMEDPVVGGLEPHKVALRRAISLGVDLEREIHLVRRGQAIPAQGVMGPNTFGYNPLLKTEMGDYNVGRAKALLDLHGYADRNGDGWREQPDGKPLVIEMATQPDGQSRQLAEQWERNMKAIGIKIQFKVSQWPENLKASRNGKLQMWNYGWSVGTPDADGFLAIAYGPNKGGANHSRFALPAYDKLFEQQQRMPDSPERQQIMTDAARLLVAYMPYKVHVHRYFSDITQPWVVGYNRNMAIRDFWRYVDIDEAELARRQAAR